MTNTNKVLAKKLFYQLKSPKKSVTWANAYFLLTKQKCKQPPNVSENGFFKHVLEFCRPSKFLCQTFGAEFMDPLRRES
jgi:hypothetical protein